MEYMKPEMEDKKEGYEKYELENACDTLLRAEMIKQDSKMMAALKPYLEDKAKAMAKITSIEDIKMASKKKSME
jgi:hypothetical protein